MSHWQAQLLSGPLGLVAMQPGVDGEDIFTYSRLRRRAYSSKTEIYQMPLLGSCLPSGSCTESVREDRKRKQKTESGSSHRAMGISNYCPLQFIHLASNQQVIFLPFQVQKNVKWDRAGLSQGEIFTSMGWTLAVEAVWSWFFHRAAHGELPVAANQLEVRAWQTQSRGKSPLCHGARRHLVIPHGDPRRNLQCKRQMDSQSPKMGPGPKGAAPTVSTSLLLEGSAKHQPSLSQPPPCADVAEPRNTGR